LERRLELAEQNLLVDNELLRAARAAYPTEIQQSGFLLSDAAQ